MQLIFQGFPLAALVALPANNHLADFLKRTEIQHILIFSAGLFVIGQVTFILSLWGASKAIVHRDAALLMNAVKVWLFQWVMVIALTVALFFIVPSLIKSGEQARVWLFAGGVALLGLMLTLLIPMKVYVIGLLRSVLVLLLAGVINVGVSGALQVVIIQTTGLKKDLADLQATFGKTPTEQRAFAQRLAGQDATDEIDRMLDDALHPIGPQPLLSQREAMVRTLQQKLSARQNALNLGNPGALAAYQAQLNRYLAFRNEVLAERNGQPAAAAP